MPFWCCQPCQSGCDVETVNFDDGTFGSLTNTGTDPPWTATHVDHAGKLTLTGSASAELLWTKDIDDTDQRTFFRVAADLEGTESSVTGSNSGGVTIAGSDWQAWFGVEEGRLVLRYLDSDGQEAQSTADLEFGFFSGRVILTAEASPCGHLIVLNGSTDPATEALQLTVVKDIDITTFPADIQMGVYAPDNTGEEPECLYTLTIVSVDEGSQFDTEGYEASQTYELCPTETEGEYEDADGNFRLFETTDPHWRLEALKFSDIFDIHGDEVGEPNEPTGDYLLITDGEMVVTVTENETPSNLRVWDNVSMQACAGKVTPECPTLDVGCEDFLCDEFPQFVKVTLPAFEGDFGCELIEGTHVLQWLPDPDFGNVWRKTVGTIDGQTAQITWIPCFLPPLALSPEYQLSVPGAAWRVAHTEAVCDVNDVFESVQYDAADRVSVPVDCNPVDPGTAYPITVEAV